MQNTLNQILLLCGEIKGETAGIKEELNRIANVQRSDDGRISKLEHKSAWLAGVAAGVSAVVSFFMSHLKGN